MLTKQSLRTSLAKSRSAMPVHDRLASGKQIVTAVQTILSKLNFSSVHCYDPLAKLAEVDVSPLLDTPECTVFTSLKRSGEWQIINVLSNQIAQSPIIGVFIVPMLGFDADLNRLGYGGGYYDRLLAEYPRALKIGVCFEQGRQPQIPYEPHDVKMDIIVTEASVIVAM